MGTDMHELLMALFATAEPARSNHYITRGVGFYVTDRPEDCWTVICHQGEFEFVPGLKTARFVIIGDHAAFAGLPANSLPSELTLLPSEWRIYLPPPVRPLLGLTKFEGKEPFALPHKYPVALNPFLVKKYQPEPIPPCQPGELPQLIAEGHADWVRMYDYAWQTAYSNLRQPEPDSGFVGNFIDTAFNTNTFLWDSCFMTMFGRYARQQVNFMGTLDNFYCKQHADGFICREINTYQGHDLFESLDPRSTGPNVFAWSEWLDYQLSQDRQRLRDVFPALIGYHNWWKDWRTWPDGSYWTTGLGSGMDNQARVPDSGQHHRHYAWLDATCQQAVNCKMLLQIADVIDWHEFDEPLQQEYAGLTRILNDTMWDEASGFYYDRAPDGSLSSVKSIGAFWALLANVVPPERAERLFAHLADPAQFNRPHRVPSQAADDPSYQADGSYWLGGVWSPTNYMVLQALTQYKRDDLAFDIALNHVENVTKVFTDTGTLWETYAPESAVRGSQAKEKFVGWTGVSAITIPIEYLIGLRWTGDVLVWDIRLTERHGVQRLPIGSKDQMTALCMARASAQEKPRVEFSTTAPVTLELRCGGHRKRFDLQAGTHQLSL